MIVSPQTKSKLLKTFLHITKTNISSCFAFVRYLVIHIQRKLYDRTWHILFPLTPSIQNSCKIFPIINFAFAPFSQNFSKFIHVEHMITKFKALKASSKALSFSGVNSGKFNGIAPFVYNGGEQEWKYSSLRRGNHLKQRPLLLLLFCIGSHVS